MCRDLNIHNHTVLQLKGVNGESAPLAPHNTCTMMTHQERLVLRSPIVIRHNSARTYIPHVR